MVRSYWGPGRVSRVVAAVAGVLGRRAVPVLLGNRGNYRIPSALLLLKLRFTVLHISVEAYYFIYIV